MLQFFGILLAAILFFKLKAKSFTTPKTKTLSQVEAMPRPMAILAPSQELIEGLNLPQAPALPVGFTPKNSGFETPPIMGGAGNPFLTF